MGGWVRASEWLGEGDARLHSTATWADKDEGKPWSGLIVCGPERELSGLSICSMDLREHGSQKPLLLWLTGVITYGVFGCYPYYVVLWLCMHV